MKLPEPFWPTGLAERFYLAMGLLSVGLLTVCLTDRGAGVAVTLPALVGSAGLYFQWIAAPVVVLFGIAINLLIAQRFVDAQLPLDNILLAASVVGYCVAHFRYCSLRVAQFPADPRRPIRPPTIRRTRPGWPMLLLMWITVVPALLYVLDRRSISGAPEARPHPRRCPPTDDEFPWAIGYVIGCPVLAVIAWGLIRSLPTPLRMVPAQWQLGVGVWLILLSILAVAGITGYRALRRMTGTEAILRLQDIAWTETRAEQRSAGRWRYWRRLKERRPG